MDDSVDWRKLREFAGVDLTKSYVLSWSVEGDTLCIEVDLYLTPEHPFYEKPRPAEKVCIRPAVVEFPYCEALTLDGEGSDEPIAAVAERIGLGAISGLVRHDEGPFEVQGRFGSVSIDAERPILRLRQA
ncbi:MAG: hypothetical protein QNI99_15885 [Woeseiaceae bacterium]|nr:hypothetical protein [Woeseiaceae bacterium]